jgi:hypothetical protein
MTPNEVCKILCPYSRTFCRAEDCNSWCKDFNKEWEGYCELTLPPPTLYYEERYPMVVR